MYVYSNLELADMHLIYGRANGSSRKAVRIYQRTFPGRRVPNYHTFAAIDRRLREYGQFLPVTTDRGAHRTIRTPDVEEQIMQHVEGNLSTSTRRIAAEESVSHMSVWRVLNE